MFVVCLQDNQLPALHRWATRVWAAVGSGVKRVCVPAEVPELDASRRRLSWRPLALSHYVYLGLYIFRYRILRLEKVTYFTPANGNPVIDCCPLNHRQTTAFHMVSH